MTLIFNPSKYSELLSRYQPKVIRNEKDNETALAIIEELMARPNRTPEEDELYELLVVLVEKFEREYYQPGSSSTPHSMLLFLMEQQGIETADLANIFDLKVVTELVSGKEEISTEQAVALGTFFHVEPGVFLTTDEHR